MPCRQWPTHRLTAWACRHARDPPISQEKLVRCFLGFVVATEFAHDLSQLKLEEAGGPATNGWISLLRSRASVHHFRRLDPS